MICGSVSEGKTLCITGTDESKTTFTSCTASAGNGGAAYVECTSESSILSVQFTSFASCSAQSGGNIHISCITGDQCLTPSQFTSTHQQIPPFSMFSGRMECRVFDAAEGDQRRWGEMHDAPPPALLHSPSSSLSHPHPSSSLLLPIPSIKYKNGFLSLIILLFFVCALKYK